MGLGTGASRETARTAARTCSCDSHSQIQESRGRILWGDESAAILIKHIFQERRCNGLVTPVSSSRILKGLADKHHKRLIWTPVGSIHVSRTMLTQGIDLGVEDNGGLFYAPHIPVRDGTLTTLLMAETLTLTKRSLSDLRRELPETHIAKETVPCSHKAKPLVLQALEKASRGGRTETLDGLKIWFSGKSWILIRASGTEPLIRLSAESPSAKQTEKIVADYRDRISALITRHS